MPGGFGGGGFGGAPFGGGSTSPQGPDAPLDLYCFEGDAVPTMLADPRVEVLGSGPQFVPDAGNKTLSVWSGEGTTARASLGVDSPVPGSFTVEWRVRFAALPLDFLRLAEEHVYLGAWSRQGAAVGLFFSRSGVAYTGAVAFTPDLELVSPFERIPDSHEYIETGRTLVIRVAASSNTGVAYLYITPEEELETTGHKLRAVLPAFDTEETAALSDRTLLSIRSSTERAEAVLSRWCLYGAQLVPNLRPIANAGRDAQVRVRESVRLDGRESFDPDGFALSYLWRLIDAPEPSGWTLSGADGQTVEDPGGFGKTDRFRAPGLQSTEAGDPIEKGDVLLLGTAAHTIVGKSALPVFELLLGERVLEDDLDGAHYRVIRQRGLRSSAEAEPSCYIETPGFYRFDLVVNDGLLESERSVVSVHATESPIPRGLVPDARFLFRYLSDFWELVEDKEQIPVFWSALAQITATELHTLWQHEYSKSLRDIPRQVLRRFLHYDTTLDEPNPDETTLRSLWGGVVSKPVPSGSLGSVVGEYDVTIDDESHQALVATTPASEADWALSLAAALKAIDPKFSVRRVERRDGDAALCVVAPFPFSLDGPGGVFLARNGHPAGATLTALGPKLARVDRSLQGLDIQQDDLLCVGGEALRIARVLDSPGDAFPHQRVLLKDALPHDARRQWAIPSQLSSQLLDFYRGLVSEGDHAIVEVGAQGQTTATIGVCGVCAARPSVLLIDRSDVREPELGLLRVARRTYIPIHRLIRDVPELTAKLELLSPSDEQQVLRRNVDYVHAQYRGDSALCFVAGSGGQPDVWEGQTPPRRLWAEHTYVDNAPTIEANFGVLADFRLADFEELGNDADYLSVVRGLWYAHLRPPTLHTLRVATQILLGLPFAEQSGVIEEIRTEYTPALGRILVREDDSPAGVRAYTYPKALGLEDHPEQGRLYEIGDRVAQFSPLVRGAVVRDYVNDPQWFRGLVRQGLFTDPEKYNHFLVRVDSKAFSLETLLFVRKFLLRIRPPWTKPLFIVESSHEAEIDVSDEVTQTATLSLHESPCRNRGNAEYRFDEPDQSGGGWENQLDGNSDPAGAPPTFPLPNPVDWGVDKERLCPEDEVAARTCSAHPGGGVRLDSGFKLDENPATSYEFLAAGPFSVTTSGISIGGTRAAIFPGDISAVRIEIAGGPGDAAVDYEVAILVDGTEATAAPFEATPFGTLTAVAAAVSLNLGDAISVRIRARSGAAVRDPDWTEVSVLIEQSTGYPWKFDEPLTAGTYCTIRAL